MQIDSRFVSRCACLAVLPVAIMMILSGCGASDDDNPPFEVPSPFPSVAVTPTPIVSPTPAPSATPPAQTVSGTLTLETQTGRIATAPFTPTTSKADSNGIPGVPREFTVESREPVTAPNGNPVIYRRLRMSLPSGMTAGTEVRFNSPSTVTLINVRYDETQNSFNSVYNTRFGTDGGKVTLVSIKDDIYTFDVAVTLEAGTEQEFRVRGQISLYLPPAPQSVTAF